MNYKNNKVVVLASAIYIWWNLSSWFDTAAVNLNLKKLVRTNWKSIKVIKYMFNGERKVKRKSLSLLPLGLCPPVHIYILKEYVGGWGEGRGRSEDEIGR